MKKRYVITNVPTKLPFLSTVLYSFLLYYFHTSGLLWGIFITLYVIYWILAIVNIVNEEKIDINPDDKSDEKKEKVKSDFIQKLVNLKNKTS